LPNLRGLLECSRYPVRDRGKAGDAMSEPINCLVCPDGILPGMTGACPICGSTYRRGALITTGRVRKRIPVRSRIGTIKRIDFDALPWQSYQTGKTREQAIENLWIAYRQHPRKYARKDPSEMYEVTRATVDRDHRGQPIGVWVLTVRRKVEP
jgi:hypothetical protein